MELIAQGAEAKIYLDSDVIIKERFSKKYREPSLDTSLRRFRTRREAKVIKKLNELGIGSPKLISVDDKEMKITMSYLKGDLLCDVIENQPGGFGRMFGLLLGRLHLADIIHGDATTSNVIVVNGDLHFIDFGLSEFTIKTEPKSVELHLLKRALESRHPECADLVFERLLEAYIEAYPSGVEVIERYQEKVVTRGRHKQK